ncbi:MAG TPA: hypothetical protein VMW47_01915 [Verrucomicrobiae bacterium]|nr:hypothetical protein [Verrucomicrobiae bacterium]
MPVPAITLVSTDLWLQSRVAAVARGAGAVLGSVAGPPVPADAVLVAVDCNHHQAERLAVIAALIADHPDRQVLAILPHRDLVTRRAARAAGAHRCVPNSALDAVLPGILARASGPGW